MPNTGSLSGLTASTSYVLDAVHVDSSGNVSAVDSSPTFTTDAAAAGGVTFEQEVAGVTHDSGQNNYPYESNSITLGAGSNRLLVAAIALNATTNAVDLSDMQADFGAQGRTFGDGITMTVLAPTNTNGRKQQIAFALLVAPSGDGTVMFNSATGTITAGDIRLYEFSGASQTVGDHTAFTADGANAVTTLSNSGTAVAGALVTALSIERGDYTSEISFTGDVTVDAVTNPGGAVIAACSNGYASDAVSAGAASVTATWTTAQAAEMRTLNVAEA